MRMLKQIVATTHADRHGESFALEALEEMANQVASRCVPVLHEHDPRIPPLGRTVSAEVIRLPDGEHALVVKWESFGACDVAPPVDPGRRIELREYSDGVSVDVDRSYRHDCDCDVLSQLEAQGVAITWVEKKALDPISVLAIAALVTGFFGKMGADLWDSVWAGVRKLLAHRRRTEVEFLLVLEIQLRAVSGPLSVAVILDSPSESEVDRFIRDIERLMRAVAPELLALGHEIVRVVMHYEDGELRPSYVIRSDGYPGLFRKLDSED